MDEAKNHILNKEFSLSDGKVKRCNGFVILTASVDHPKLRKLVPRTTMETEDACNVDLFMICFTEVLRKEKKDDIYFFKATGWITDMAGSNMEGLKRAIAPHALHKLKTCEFYFKECINRQVRMIDRNLKTCAMPCSKK